MIPVLAVMARNERETLVERSKPGLPKAYREG